MKQSIYDIGNPRPDGKRNVWVLFDVRGQGPEWVIVHVGDNKHEAIVWIREREKVIL